MFTKQERLIFKYEAAGKPCVADPLRLLQRLMTKASNESIDADFKLLTIDKPESLAAFLRLADLGRFIFDLKQLSVDEKGEVHGVTDAEAVTLLVEFSTWIEEVQGRFFESQAAELYGASVLEFGSQPVSYECFCGLWLNRTNALFQRAFSTAAAVGVALGGKHPPGWFEALLGDKAAANAVNAKVEKMRMGAEDKKTLSMVEHMQKEARGNAAR